MERAELVPTSINHQMSGNGFISASAAATDMHLTGKANTPEHVPSCLLRISFLAFVDADSLHDSAAPAQTHSRGAALRPKEATEQFGLLCYRYWLGMV